MEQKFNLLDTKRGEFRIPIKFLTNLPRHLKAIENFIHTDVNTTQVSSAESINPEKIATKKGKSLSYKIRNDGNCRYNTLFSSENNVLFVSK